MNLKWTAAPNFKAGKHSGWRSRRTNICECALVKGMHRRRFQAVHHESTCSGTCRLVMESTVKKCNFVNARGMSKSASLKWQPNMHAAVCRAHCMVKVHTKQIRKQWDTFQCPPSSSVRYAACLCHSSVAKERKTKQLVSCLCFACNAALLLVFRSTADPSTADFATQLLLVLPAQIWEA